MKGCRLFPPFSLALPPPKVSARSLYLNARWIGKLEGWKSQTGASSLLPTGRGANDSPSDVAGQFSPITATLAPPTFEIRTLAGFHRTPAIGSTGNTSWPLARFVAGLIAQRYISSWKLRQRHFPDEQKLPGARMYTKAMRLDGTTRLPLRSAAANSPHPSSSICVFLSRKPRLLASISLNRLQEGKVDLYACRAIALPPSIVEARGPFPLDRSLPLTGSQAFLLSNFVISIFKPTKCPHGW